jgi:hypothetical protein
MIGPIFAKMSEEMPDVEFVGVDVDEAEDIAAGKCTTSASWYCSYWLQWSLHRILHVPQLTLSILFICLFVCVEQSAPSVPCLPFTFTRVGRRSKKCRVLTR